MKMDSEDENKSRKRLRRERRRDFEKFLRAEVLTGGVPLRKVGRYIMQNLGLLHTKFGQLVDKLEEAAEDTVRASGPAAPDLLPISVVAVQETTIASCPEVKDWMALTCLCLNFWYCTGWERPSHTSHPRELTSTQKEFLGCHLGPAIERMLEGGTIDSSIRSTRAGPFNERARL